MRMCEIFFGFFLCLYLISAHTENELVTVIKAEYDITYRGILIGKTTEIFERTNQIYKISSTTQPKGIANFFLKKIEREATGKITPTGLQPEIFIEKRQQRKQRTAEFNWGAKKLKIEAGKAVTHLEINSDNAVDQASFFWLFNFRALNHENELEITDGKRIKTYTYVIQGQEILSSRIGKINTVIVEKTAVHSDKRRVKIWLAPDHFFLPVKMVFADKKGRIFISNISQLEAE